MDIVTPAHPGNDGGRDNVDDAAPPIDLVGDPGTCGKDDQGDRESAAQGNGRGMRTALIGIIEDLVFPGKTAKISNAPIREGSEKDKYDDEGHRNDCKRCFISTQNR